MMANPVRIGFIGAGQINFGAFEGQKSEGAWDHSKRLQELPDVVFTAVVDPNASLAERRIAVMQSGEHGSKWAAAKAFKTNAEMLASPEKPDAVFIGVPPLFHGSLDDPSADMEVQLAKAGLHLFIEKPLSVRPAEEVARLAQELSQLQKQHGLIIGVGYMLRYSPAIQAARQLLQKFQARPAAVIARYACGYSNIAKPDWWDTARCGGPIVEQATHFIDLMRYFGGEVAAESIRAVAVGPGLPLSDMPPAPAGEHTVAEERRINRATACVFHFEGGSVGSLTHTVLLHGATYYTVFEIMADGLHIIIKDPYGQAQLLLRKPHSDAYEEVALEPGDMYMSQAKAFVDAVSSRDPAPILSVFSDAVESYKLSKHITEASSVWPESTG